MSQAHAHAHDEHGDDYYVHSHISSVQTYIAVLGALLFLTLLTVAAYNIRLGDMNLAVAVVIATIKASIVCAWFMHMKYEQKFNIVFFVGSLLFVTVFFVYTFNDTAHRGRQHSLVGLKVDPTTGLYAEGTPPLIAGDNNGEFIALPPVSEGDEAPEAAAAPAQGEAQPATAVAEDEAVEAEDEANAGEAAEGEPSEGDEVVEGDAEGGEAAEAAEAAEGEAPPPEEAAAE